MRRIAAFILVLVAFSAGAVVPAAADPKTEPLYLDCTEPVPDGWITSNGNGQWTPGHAVAGTGNYIPYAFEFSFYFTPENGVEGLVETDAFEKKAPKNSHRHAHGVCTFGETFPIVDDPDLGTGTGRFEGTAWVFWTGK